jgi:deazaflavin-dependent oxidoreductase (nitroreductase family)
MPGRPLLLLTTTGAKSGQRRTTPLMYIADGERLLVIASAAGAPKHPDWYHNLAAYPQVTVEVGKETFDATAAVLEGAERQQVWDRITQQYAFFTEHQAKVTRQIPVVALQRQQS